MENSNVIFLWTRFQHHTFATAIFVLGGHILVMIIAEMCSYLKFPTLTSHASAGTTFDGTKNTPYNHNCGKCSVSGGRHFGFMQIKHFLRLSQIWTPSSDVLGEVYAKFGSDTMDIAKGIKICK